jgi:Fic/DOC family
VTDYVTVVEAVAIHTDQIERYGGAVGVRDHGLLEAALLRPQTGYYADLIEEAAALWESLSQNHPFVDGNKRTAFAVTYVFLQRGPDIRKRGRDRDIPPRPLCGRLLRIRASEPMAAGERDDRQQGVRVGATPAPSPSPGAAARRRPEGPRRSRPP